MGGKLEFSRFWRCSKKIFFKLKHFEVRGEFLEVFFREDFFEALRIEHTINFRVNNFHFICVIFIVRLIFLMT